MTCKRYFDPEGADRTAKIAKIYEKTGISFKKIRNYNRISLTLGIKSNKSYNDFRTENCGHSIVVMLQPSKLIRRVRFPLPAPVLSAFSY